MLHILNDGRFQPATQREATEVMPAFSALGSALQTIASTHGLSARADGISIDARASDAVWESRWTALQTALLKQGADHGLNVVRRTRADAFSGAASSFGSQDLIQNYGKIFEEKRAPIKYRDTFMVESSIPLGADSYRVRMNVSSGEAQRYRLGDQVSAVALGVKEEVRPVHIYVASYTIPWLYGQNGAFAGANLNTRLLASARQAVEYVYDELSFVGSDDSWGLKNYPGLPRYTATTALSAMTADNLKDFLITILRRPAENSKTAIQPTVLEVAPEIMTYASTLTLTNTSMTVANWLTEQENGQGGKYKLMQNWRMSNFGGTGIHGAFARGEGEGTLSIEATPPLVIPGPASEWSQTTYVVGQFGGAINPYPIGMEIGLVSAS